MPSCKPAREALVGYLNPRSPCALDLVAQRRTVDAVAARRGRRVDTYLVEEARPAKAGVRGPLLADLIATARTSRETLAVVVPDARCLGATRADARMALVDMLIAGIAIMDLTGELRPADSTRAIAEAYRSDRSVRRTSGSPRAGASSRPSGRPNEPHSKTGPQGNSVPASAGA